MMSPQGFAQREINCQISCVTGRDRDLNLVRHEFLHYKLRIKYVSLSAEFFFFPPLWWAANIFTAAPTSDLEKGSKTDTDTFIRVGNSHSSHERRLGSKKLSGNQTEELHNRLGMCSKKSNRKQGHVKRRSSLRIIAQRCYVMLQTPPN